MNAQASIPGIQIAERAPTFGERACGVTFNPGGSALVAEIKQQFADLVDKVHGLRIGAGMENDSEKARMYSIAITDLQTAQMWAVKAATWRG